MGTMEEQIRKIVREEIARALSAASEVADNAAPTYTKAEERFTLQSIRSVMQRVARDVLANQHPEHTRCACTTNLTVETCGVCEHAVHSHRPCSHGASTEPEALCTACSHTKHTGRQCGHRLCTCTTMPSTEPVHTITAVPERTKATCTCHRHTHVMGHDDRCGAPFCYCLSPLRARTADGVKAFGEHASTEACTYCNHPLQGHQGHQCAGKVGKLDCPCPYDGGRVPSTETLDYNRECTACKHGEHDQGKCGMHVYLRGVASPCPCLASRTLGAQPSTRPSPMCTVCEHAPHGAGNCGAVVNQHTPFAAPCECSGARPEPSMTACSVCEHAPHEAHLCSATIRKADGWTMSCECGVSE